MGLGLLELIIIAVAALVLLGPERLPDALRQLGRFYVQLRRTSNEFRGVFDNMVRQAEEELKINEIKRLNELARQGSKIAENAVTSLQNPPSDHSSHSSFHSIEPPPVVDLDHPHGRNQDAANAWEQNIPPPSLSTDKKASPLELTEASTAKDGAPTQDRKSEDPKT